MPKKKTGAAKKAEKQRVRQKELRTRERDLADLACNSEMACDACGRRQKNRAFCYFCDAIQRLPQCAQCGKTKCMASGGDCLVKHANKFAVGMALIGAICDFCEAWVCHSRRCIQQHTCPCPLTGSVCVECDRGVVKEDGGHGGRVYRCSFCRKWLCEDDQFEHQAKCQTLEAETYKCQSCNRMGLFSCLQCKICFCEDHVKRKGVKYDRKKAYPCPKCGYDTKETKALSMSVRKMDYGRQQHADDDEESSGAGFYGYGAGYSYGDGGGESFYNDEDENQAISGMAGLGVGDDEGAAAGGYRYGGGYSYGGGEEEDEDEDEDDESYEDSEEDDDDDDDEAEDKE